MGQMVGNILVKLLFKLVIQLCQIYFAGKSFTQQEMVDAACGRVSETAGLSYYALSWQIIAQMTLNGEVSKAGKLFNEDVVPTSPPVTSPTNIPIATSSPTIVPTSATGEILLHVGFFSLWCGQLV